MKKSDFIAGLVLGGVIGAAAVLLYTPQSGDTLRLRMRDFVQNFGSEVRRAAEGRREQLQQELEVLRAPKEQGE